MDSEEDPYYDLPSRKEAYSISTKGRFISQDKTEKVEIVSPLPLEIIYTDDPQLLALQKLKDKDEQN